jgi:hypothetical protein
MSLTKWIQESRNPTAISQKLASSSKLLRSRAQFMYYATACRAMTHLDTAINIGTLHFLLNPFA